MLTFIKDSIQVYFQKWVEMNPIFILMIVGFLVQFTKVLLDSLGNKKISFIHVFSAGWFPSFHTGIATSITTMIWLTFGFDSIRFALSCGFALLFAYDAMNIRFQSGKQAKYINEIRLDLKSVLTKQGKEIPLKERLWHTPLEVLWGILIGFITTFILYYYFIII